LTHDQELQIENLLISTVTKISLLTGSVMEALATNHPTKEVAVGLKRLHSILLSDL
jgi:hypothetical protein